MQEEAIAQTLNNLRVQNNIDTTPTGVEVDVGEPTGEEDHNHLPMDNLIAKQEMVNYFQIPPTAKLSADVQTHIETVMRWAQSKAGDNDLASIFRVIRETEEVLGNQHRSDRLYRLYQYVKLHQQKRLLDERMLAL